MMHLLRSMYRKFHTKKIAIVSLSSGDVYAKTEAAFITRLLEHVNANKLNIRLQIEVFSGNDSKETLEKLVENNFSGTNYDLVLSVGSTATLMLKVLSIKSSSKIPIVFCNVHDSLNQELTQQPLYAKSITGIFAKARNYDEQIAQLLLMKKDIKKAAVICSDESFYAPERLAAVAAFEKNNVETIWVSFSDSEDIKHNMQKRLSGVDIILPLRDWTSLSNMQLFIDFCNTNNVLLYASDIESVRKGAALAYADYDDHIGQEAAAKAIHILFGGKVPYQIPITVAAWNNKLFINSYTIKQQGSNVDLSKATVGKVIIF